MTSPAEAPKVRVIFPERFSWAPKILLAIAIVSAIAAIAALGIYGVQAVAWLQPDVSIPIVLQSGFDLPVSSAHHQYFDVPYVPDGSSIRATQVATSIAGLPFGGRLALGLTPAIWSLTAAIVAIYLVIALSRISTGSGFGRNSSSPVIKAAIVLAIGSSIAQLLQGVADLSVSRVAWPSLDGIGFLTGAGGFTFSFSPLLAAAGLLVVALILQRGLALQDDLDTLV